MADDGTRLNKYLAEAGVASRRAADRLIADGQVIVNGRPAVLGDRVGPEDIVEVDGKAVRPSNGTVILAFNKPRGLVCTANTADEDSIISFINYPRRIFTVGRLDKDSEGLILLTNNGDLANRIMRSRYGHEKEYVVTVDKDVTPELVKGLAAGVLLEEGTVTRRCHVKAEGPRILRIVLRQGLNRQIRRMLEHYGYTVKQLVRVRVMNIELGDLKSGRYRDISRRERDELIAQLDASELAPKDGE
ncbi:MAG: pseudouridine synthase [Methanomethylophilus sp.]|jgi:23S rRNA pseudouridine2604 synthase